MTDLFAGVQPETLINLIISLAKNRPDVLRDCYDYLKKHVLLTPEQKTRSEGEIVMTLWAELSPDLELLDEVLPFIASGNAGFDDMLYDLADATCYNDEDLRGLAQAFEAMNQDWPRDHARRIYRKLGDLEKYLELRLKQMKYGGDYHDLAKFYWDEGNGSKALSVAEEGIKKGKGRMDELRQFLADRALEGGDRNQYLALQFEQATDHLTLAKYKEFKKICTDKEWLKYEDKILKKMNDIWASERLNILMHRTDYDKALAVLLKERYPNWDSNSVQWTAEHLESRFPEQILTFYLSGFDRLKSETTCKGYAARARVMLKIRRVLVDILKDEKRWKTFAGKIKAENLRRPALQEEFAGVIPGWRDLGMG